MKYLGLALFAEGPGDHRFLSPLLRRLMESLCAGRASVEIPEVLELHSPVPSSEASRAIRIAEAAVEAAGFWNILFVHADAAGDPDRARRELVDPGFEEIEQRLEEQMGGVGVIPVRETEAWALADGDALRGLLGSRMSDAELGLPTQPRQVEGIEAPKRELSRVLGLLRGGRRSRRKPRRGSPYLENLGEQVALETLRRVPAFAVVERQSREMLERLRYL